MTELARATKEVPHDRQRLIATARETLAELQTLPAHCGLRGTVGDALFACELRRLDPGSDATPLLARAARAIAAHRPGPSLHRGLAGLGFVLATYCDAEDRLGEIDETIASELTSLPPASMQSGLAGLALYASLRSHANSGRRLQRAILTALANAATPNADGVVWHTPTSYARCRRVTVVGEPVTEFGMTHGIAGTLVGLAALAHCGHHEAAELARAGLRALWTFERPGANRFGRIVFGPGGDAGTLELDGRWCVGDVGVYRACWLVANTIDDERSAEHARSRLRELAHAHASTGSAGDPYRFDLCCGSSVIAEVHLRMYRETGEPIFLSASDRLSAVCAERLPTIVPANVAYGRAGVLLALLARDMDRPAWDSMLGISLPAPCADRPRSCNLGWDSVSSHEQRA